MPGMEPLPVRVECYSGYKGDETPRAFEWRDWRLEIEAIIDRWYHGSPDPRTSVQDYFKVQAVDGKEYILKHDREKNRWYLIQK